MTFNPLDLVSAQPWNRVAFTTYALSLSFFEAIILDALMRGRSNSQPLILADVAGVRDSLSEQGAHRVGKDYEVEPVVVSGGVFHAKVSVFINADDCHVLVGSGNLTFSGWGGNCEVLEHLHPSFAANAISDAADFFELLPRTSRVRIAAVNDCATIADGLRRSIRGRSDNGDIRFLHTLNGKLTDQIAAMVRDLGGAVRVVAAAPFWDGGVAIDKLCEAVQIDEVFVHAHAKGCVGSLTSINWPRNARKNVHAVRIATMDDPEQAGRPLHAKAFEVLCRRGRLLVSGSANASTAALGPDANIEACVARLQRNQSTGWTYVPAEPPEPQPHLEPTDVDEEVRRSGVLRAVLTGDELSGQVLIPKLSGDASIYYLAPAGPELLAETVIGVDGTFTIVAPDLERWSWRGGRLVIRARDLGGRQAEGFVSVASFGEIARRSGPVTRQLFALLFGSETPEDVAAILNWFHDDPRRMAPVDLNEINHGAAGNQPDRPEVIIPVAALTGDPAPFPETPPAEMGHRSWSRFLDQIVTAFREPRAPFASLGALASGENESDDDGSPRDRDKKQGKATSIEEAYASFEKLFSVLTEDAESVRKATIAFELTGYICARLRPEASRAKAWLEALLRTFLRVGVPAERRDSIAAAVLTVLGMEPDDGRYRWARGYLLHLGIDLSAPPPSDESVRNYLTVMQMQEDFGSLWTKLGVIRTFPEQVDCYLDALNTGNPTPARYADLIMLAREEWPVLEAAITSKETRTRMLFAKGTQEVCPVHRISLPQREANKLRAIGIATTNCCGKVLIRQTA